MRPLHQFVMAMVMVFVVTTLIVILLHHQFVILMPIMVSIIQAIVPIILP